MTSGASSATDSMGRAPLPAHRSCIRSTGPRTMPTLPSRWRYSAGALSPLEVRRHAAPAGPVSPRGRDARPLRARAAACQWHRVTVRACRVGRGCLAVWCPRLSERPYPDRLRVKKRRISRVRGRRLSWHPRCPKEPRQRSASACLTAITMAATTMACRLTSASAISARGDGEPRALSCAGGNMPRQPVAFVARRSGFRGRALSANSAPPAK